MSTSIKTRYLLYRLGDGQVAPRSLLELMAKSPDHAAKHVYWWGKDKILDENGDDTRPEWDSSTPDKVNALLAWGTDVIALMDDDTLLDVVGHAQYTDLPGGGKLAAVKVYVQPPLDAYVDVALAALRDAGFNAAAEACGHQLDKDNRLELFGQTTVTAKINRILRGEVNP